MADRACAVEPAAVIDLHQLKTFVAVAGERSITRASELLHLSQPDHGNELAGDLLLGTAGVWLLGHGARADLAGRKLS